MRTGRRRQMVGGLLFISISSLTFVNTWVRLPAERKAADQPKQEATREAGYSLANSNYFPTSVRKF